jgi:alpha-tubulin suppressor-like RCC1 family protein
LGQESTTASALLTTTTALNPGKMLAGIAAGANHYCVNYVDGTGACWGRAAEGQLFSGTTFAIGASANTMGSNLPLLPLPSGKTIKSIFAGAYHSCALFNSNETTCWGDNTLGALGIGYTGATFGSSSSDMSAGMQMVNLGTGRTAVSLALGQFFSCALLDTAVVKCWGSNVYGQLGVDSTVSVGTTASLMGNALSPSYWSGGPVMAVAVGYYHQCVLVLNVGAGQKFAMCCGANSACRLCMSADPAGTRCRPRTTGIQRLQQPRRGRGLPNHGLAGPRDPLGRARHSERRRPAHVRAAGQQHCPML